jgi:hypothetical protein
MKLIKKKQYIITIYYEIVKRKIVNSVRINYTCLIKVENLKLIDNNLKYIF